MVWNYNFGNISVTTKISDFGFHFGQLAEILSQNSFKYSKNSKIL
jgi:hypothetical protein